MTKFTPNDHSARRGEATASKLGANLGDKLRAAGIAPPDTERKSPILEVTQLAPGITATARRWTAKDFFLS